MTEYKSKRKTFKERIEEASLKFKDKLDFSKSVRLNNTKSITFICKDHGENTKSIYNILKSEYGSCDGCKTDLVMKKNGIKFIEECKLKYNNKYDYSLVEYKGNAIDVKIICPIHGEFKQTPKNHKNHECDKCGTLKMSDKKRTSLKNFIERANKAHNNKYTYENVVYVNNKTKIMITCPIHGDFPKIPKNHLGDKTKSPSGCGKCMEELLKK